jgi:hypothetical protein
VRRQDAVVGDGREQDRVGREEVEGGVHVMRADECQETIVVVLLSPLVGD